jgi:hypothetical protein
MTFGDRIKFYGFGFVLGILVLSMALNKKCSNAFGFLKPREMKMKELQTQVFKYSSQVACYLKCVNTDTVQLKQAFANAKINYDRSDIQAKPYGIYLVEGQLASGLAFTATIGDNGNESIIKDITFAKIKCYCPNQ